jgi:DTW domain-containing protein YfiP
MSPNRGTIPRCPRCFYRGDPCLCPEVPRVSARLEVVILRHAAELKKQTNSARWAALALGCRVIDYAATAEPFDDAALDTGGAWLLFPGAEPTPAPAAPPRRLIVVDGTWQQARRMVLRLPALRSLPRLTLKAAPAGPRLRRPHDPAGMSTLEAVAEALELCGEPLPAAQLRALHGSVLRRAERLRGRLPPR